MPLKKENERTVKENNDLHLKLIRVQEELDKVESKWRGSFRQLQHEREDLVFVAEQKETRNKDLERQMTELKEKLDDVMSKVYMPS
jgi:chromosome segregation ATPase